MIHDPFSSSVPPNPFYFPQRNTIVKPLSAIGLEGGQSPAAKRIVQANNHFVVAGAYFRQGIELMEIGDPLTSRPEGCGIVVILGRAVGLSHELP
jgi:hypothetical protein